MSSSVETVTCQLCGFQFAPEQNACGGCAMHSGCGLIKCPNCGTETPHVNRGIAGWLRRLLDSKKNSFNA